MTNPTSEQPSPREHDQTYTVLLIPERGARVEKLRLSVRHVSLLRRLARFRLSDVQVRLAVALVLALVAALVGMTWRLIALSGRVRDNTRLEEQNLELQARLSTIQEKIGHINGVLARTQELYARLQEISQLSDPARKLSLDAPALRDPRLPADPVRLTSQLDRLSSEAEVQSEELNTLTGYFEDRKALLASAPAIWPVRGWVTSDFGWRVDPFTGQRELHEGLDIANQEGTPVLATADGTVVYAAPDDGYGNVIVLDHGFGIKTRYAHLSKIDVRIGQRVQRGQTIGQIGDTGRATGPHLHYEVRVNGAAVNPRKFILEPEGPDAPVQELRAAAGAHVPHGMGD